ncbi:efflux RND transporter periplasmic adaptor subunit [Granulosicoccus sp. 3-233]|uniref:efflux RND transporter periplasmic adaptor subunit n=1 Tax=Granulosicoccus sp. 3-233 TaxID=3417969 RepID=UPI003D34FF14
MHRPRLFYYLISAVLIIAALWVWKSYSSAQDLPAPATASVVRGTVQDTVLATGIIEANQLVSVGARVSGQIETMAVKLGQTVAEGDLIARIDSQDQQNAVLQAKAELAIIDAQIAATRARLSQSRHDLEREEQLLSSNFTSTENVETARLNVQVYEAELEALQAQLSSAEVNVSNMQIALQRTSIHAPISGTVVAIVVDEGQTVNASQSTPTIVKIAELDTMLVKAEISEADIVQVQPGQAVTFTILGEHDREFPAEVREVEPAPSEIETSDTISSDEAVYYNALLEVDNTQHLLRIGMTTQVSIILDSANNVLRIPAAALQAGPQGRFDVQVFDPATEARTVKAVDVGLNNDIDAVILSGLSEGEQVIIGSTMARPASDEPRMRMPPMGL